MHTTTVDKVNRIPFLNLASNSAFTVVVNFIMQQFKEAEADYVKSSQLDPNFIFSHIQLAVAQYKTDQIGTALATFRKTMKMFPNRSEPLNY